MDWTLAVGKKLELSGIDCRRELELEEGTKGEIAEGKGKEGENYWRRKWTDWMSRLKNTHL